MTGSIALYPKNTNFVVLKMSSAKILFVLKRLILERSSIRNEVSRLENIKGKTTLIKEKTRQENIILSRVFKKHYNLKNNKFKCSKKMKFSISPRSI